MSEFKEVKLTEVEQAWNSLQAAQAQVQQRRETFIDTLQAAKQAKATQQEMADRINLSRQRIAQFLDERRRG